MNIKDNNLHKIIAAVVIGLLLVLMIGIAVSGRQNEDNNSGESDETISDTDESNGDTDSDSGTADNIKDEEGENNSSDEEIKVPYVPEYTNYITGMECDEQTFKSIPLVFLTDPDAPLYGISYSDLTIEMPVEGGNTRLMVYTGNAASLGKIGAITASRDYMTQLTKLFGGVMVAYGEDDAVSYPSVPSTVQIDLSLNKEYVYKENGKNIYIDNTNLYNLISAEEIDMQNYKTQSMPYEFCGFDESVSGINPASTVTIPFGTGKESTLVYDLTSGKYSLSKGARGKIDMLTGECAAYTNVFILFADTVTYEMASGVELVVESAASGTGYYVTGGSLVEINWRVDDKNQLIFEDLSGKKLVINRGNSYIAYYKSAQKDLVSFE